MTPLATAMVALLVVTIGAQAFLPRARLLIVTAGAALAILSSTLLGGASTGRILAGVPWDVLVIVVSLGLLSELLAQSRVFGLLALAATRVSGADPVRVAALFALGMYVVSGLVNNLTALLLVLPVLLNLMKLLGVTQRYASYTLGATLVACNLGGAATPIGDFPAILLLGRGAMDFNGYLRAALPQTLIALGVFLFILLVVVRPARGLPRRGLQARLAVVTMAALYRDVRLDVRRFAPAAAALAAMLVAWSTLPPAWGVGPELVAWVGVIAALACAPGAGERLLRAKVDVEAALFLFALFVMVGAVRETGVFARASALLTSLPVSAEAQLAVFLAAAAALTGLFSAGPSMAALLDVAVVLAERHPPAVVFVGLALAVCAGSSLFLTAATSGPLAQALAERAGIAAPDGAPVRFGFLQFLPTGLIGFCVILAVGLAFALGR